MRSKNQLFTLAGVLLLFLLLLAALFLPDFYFQDYDASLTAEVSYEDASLEMSPVGQYQTFRDKLFALAEYERRGIELHAVRTQEVTDRDTWTQLQAAVEEALPQLLTGFNIYEIIRVNNGLTMQSCNLYTIYSEDEDVQGMGFWKADFQMGNDYTVRVLLDTEFQKVYAYWIRAEDSGGDYLYPYKELLEADGDMEYLWVEYLMAYYDLPENYSFNYVDHVYEFYRIGVTFYQEEFSLAENEIKSKTEASISGEAAKDYEENEGETLGLPVSVRYGVDEWGLQYYIGGVDAMSAFLN